MATFKNNQLYRAGQPTTSETVFTVSATAPNNAIYRAKPLPVAGAAGKDGSPGRRGEAGRTEWGNITGSMPDQGDLTAALALKLDAASYVIPAWGNITGALSSQGDLTAALNLKFNAADFNTLGDARWSLLAHTHTFAGLTAKPTTIAGYGITDFNSLGDARWSLLAHTHAFSDLTAKPTTIAGYGITDYNSLGDARWSLLAHVHSAANTTFTPTGTISSTDVQAAIAELEAEKQPLDADLTAIAGLTSAADKGIQFTGSGTAAVYDLTAAGKALLDDATAAAQLVTLGLTADATELNYVDGVTSAIQTQMNLKAPLASPALTGTPTTPTATPGTNTTQIASTAYADAAASAAASPSGGFLRNRIINGDMRIDQRNAGVAVTAIAGGVFGVDRFAFFEDTDGGFTAVRSTSTPPAGFTHFTRVTVTSADASLAAVQYALMQTKIEGNDVADLDWGLSTAKTVTLSFQVRSSLTGTFGGSLRNSAGTRSYPFSYTISSANTWTSITVTVAGDTTGTWLTDTGIGVTVCFGLGVGTTNSGTAGAWAATNMFSATGAVSVIGTNAATWDITGVQFEAGSVATTFERRKYAQEELLCQRYLPAFRSTSTNEDIGRGHVTSSTGCLCYINFHVPARVNPTSFTSSAATTFSLVDATGGALPVGTGISAIGGSSVRIGNFNLAVASGLGSAGTTSTVKFNSASAYIYFNGCEL